MHIREKSIIHRFEMDVVGIEYDKIYILTIFF